MQGKEAGIEHILLFHMPETQETAKSLLPVPNPLLSTLLRDHAALRAAPIPARPSTPHCSFLPHPFLKSCFPCGLGPRGSKTCFLSQTSDLLHNPCITPATSANGLQWRKLLCSRAHSRDLSENCVPQKPAVPQEAVPQGPASSPW